VVAQTLSVKSRKKSLKYRKKYGQPYLSVTQQGDIYKCEYRKRGFTMQSLKIKKCIDVCKNAHYINDRFFKCAGFKTDIYYSLNAEAYHCPMFKEDYKYGKYNQ
jgi:hypothetical protein